MTIPPRIVSASRRTDIPAFYAEWFMQRVKKGFCTYPNPFRTNQIHRVSLLPEDVAGFVFWTRHAAPMHPHLQTLDRAGFAYYFLYSILGYPRTLEPRSPSTAIATKTFCELASRLGNERVIWRYDPVILTAELTPDWHRQNFRTIADKLYGKTTRVIVSIVDPYRKTQTRIGKQDDGQVRYDIPAYCELLAELAELAAERDMQMQSCAEPELTVPGVQQAACVDAELLERLSGRKISHAHHRQRPGCLCHRSVDIGINNTCGFGCAYCYATQNHTRAQEAARTGVL
jgi:hypothetical protein